MLGRGDNGSTCGGIPTQSWQVATGERQWEGGLDHQEGWVGPGEQSQAWSQRESTGCGHTIKEGLCHQGWGQGGAAAVICGPCHSFRRESCIRGWEVPGRAHPRPQGGHLHPSTRSTHQNPGEVETATHCWSPSERVRLGTFLPAIAACHDPKRAPTCTTAPPSARHTGHDMLQTWFPCSPSQGSLGRSVPCPCQGVGSFAGLGPRTDLV